MGPRQNVRNGLWIAYDPGWAKGDESYTLRHNSWGDISEVLKRTILGPDAKPKNSQISVEGVYFCLDQLSIIYHIDRREMVRRTKYSPNTQVNAGAGKLVRKGGYKIPLNNTQSVVDVRDLEMEWSDKNELGYDHLGLSFNGCVHVQLYNLSPVGYRVLATNLGTIPESFQLLLRRDDAEDTKAVGGHIWTAKLVRPWQEHQEYLDGFFN